LYINDRFYGATTNPVTLQNALNLRLESHVPDNPTARVEYVSNVDIRTGLFPVSAIREVGRLRDLINSEVAGERMYTVVRNDTPSQIALKNGISLDELVRLNPNILRRLLPGDQIVISHSVPFLGIKTTLEEVYEQTTPFETRRVENSSRYRGYTNVSVRGRNGTTRITAEVTYVNGVEAERVIKNTTVLEAPVTEVVEIGTRTAVPLPAAAVSASIGSGSNLAWPTHSRRISVGLHGYRGHTGIDIPDRIGTPIFSADDGYVVSVRHLAYGYGRHLLIDHGNGMQTLYAHCSQIFVQAGQTVTKGQHIAAIGSTGRSTGPHLHFEIRVNGRIMNPLHYY
jgi:murein DD-endopeptidase MepM/ murein hydrolase activator NlpD